MCHYTSRFFRSSAANSTFFFASFKTFSTFSLSSSAKRVINSICNPKPCSDAFAPKIDPKFREIFRTLNACRDWQRRQCPSWSIPNISPSSRRGSDRRWRAQRFLRHGKSHSAAGLCEQSYLNVTKHNFLRTFNLFYTPLHCWWKWLATSSKIGLNCQFFVVVFFK